MHLVKQLALAQFLHENGTTLLAMQLKITNQHFQHTPTLFSSIHGTKKISPSNSPDMLASALKYWMLIRYLATHVPKIPNKFPIKWAIEEIITSLGFHLQQFQLRKHTASSKYACHKNYFILDRTCKLTFKVCSVLGCFKGVTFNRKQQYNCKEHSIFNSPNEPVYTGMLLLQM